MTKALKQAGLSQAHGGKQVRLVGQPNPRTLWVVADPASDEAKRLLAITEAAALAVEYEEQAKERRMADLLGVRLPMESVRDTEVALTEQKVN